MSSIPRVRAHRSKTARRTVPGLETLVPKGRDYLREAAAKAHQTLRIGGWRSWYYDEGTGVMRFMNKPHTPNPPQATVESTTADPLLLEPTAAGKATSSTIISSSTSDLFIECRMQVVGSFNTKSETFKWAWSNPCVADAMSVASTKAYEYGRAARIQSFCEESAIDADFQVCEDLVGVVAVLNSFSVSRDQFWFPYKAEVVSGLYIYWLLEAPLLSEEIRQRIEAEVPKLQECSGGKYFRRARLGIWRPTGGRVFGRKVAV
jgi:hypothetical protein